MEDIEFLARAPHATSTPPAPATTSFVAAKTSQGPHSIGLFVGHTLVTIFLLLLGFLLTTACRLSDPSSLSCVPSHRITSRFRPKDILMFDASLEALAQYAELAKNISMTELPS